MIGSFKSRCNNSRRSPSEVILARPHALGRTRVFKVYLSDGAKIGNDLVVVFVHLHHTSLLLRLCSSAILEQDYLNFCLENLEKHGFVCFLFLHY